jgi:hypothetical protein
MQVQQRGSPLFPMFCNTFSSEYQIREAYLGDAMSHAHYEHILCSPHYVKRKVSIS